MLADLMSPGESDARRAFREEVEKTDDEIDLGRAALLVAAEDDPDTDVDWAIAQLDELGAMLRDRLEGVIAPEARATRLAELLFRDRGLRGNAEDYYARDNSHLDKVLRTGLGIPLTLSMIAIEIGRRADLPLQGVGMPGHFLVRDGWGGQLFMDPFSAGALLQREDCEKLFDRLTGGQLPFEPEYLAPVNKRSMLVRMLTNLKAIALRAQSAPAALATQERICILWPHRPQAIRDRGLLRLEVGAVTSAIEDLERYLASSPEAGDRPQIEGALLQARATWSTLN